MLQSRFARGTRSLLSLYEQNYMLFRLVLPEMPKRNGWFCLESEGKPPVYVHRLSIHPYTSEWLLGHFFPQHSKRVLNPDYVIRVYHDARLAEVVPQGQVQVREMREYKLEINRALAEWLSYCHRRGYRVNWSADVKGLPDLSVPV